MLTDKKLKAFIPTIQPEIAKAFYKNVLGLKLLSEERYFIDFDVHDSVLRIVSVEKFTPQTFTIVGWVVEDISTTIRALNEKGVFCLKYDYFEQDEFGVWVSPGGFKVAWFKDPDGNVLSINEEFSSAT